jgi:predicted enzyme related to lactoylglutathione lyase
MTPTIGHGKICYVLIPAGDIKASAAFYEKVFGWKIRTRDDGRVSFDDGIGEVSGMWMPGAKPIDASFLYIMTDDAIRTCESITREGGTITQQPDPHAREVIAQFRDPAGNVFGIYEHRKTPNHS